MPRAEAARLGFQREGDALAGPPLGHHEIGNRFHHAGGDRGDGAVGAPIGLERSGYGGDAAVNTVGQHRGKDGRAVGGKGDPLGAAPIRQIDMLLDADAVERTERKGVDGEDVSPEPGQLLAKRRQLFRLPRHRGRFTR